MPLNVRDSGRHASADVILGLVSIGLQIMLGTQLSIAGGSINFLVAFACVFALHGEPSHAVLVGFGSGLLYDLITPVPMGLMALLLTVCCFALVSMSRGTLSQLSADSMRVLAATMLVLFCLYALALLAMGQLSGIVIALLHGVVTALLSSVAAAVLLALSSRTGFSGSSLGGKGSRPRGKTFR